MFAEALISIVSRLAPLGAGGGGFWLPAQASELAKEVDSDWALVYWLSAFFFALITFLLVFFSLRYRSRPGHKEEQTASHNTPLEVVWSVIPTFLVVILFWNSYTTFLQMVTPPAGAYEVLVTGQKWNWLFTYPNGYIDADLHVPAETPVTLVMTSEDVIHAFYVPELRVKRDVMPGRYSKVWFSATQLGEYDIFCAEYCGTSHSEMLSKLVVHEPADYEAWLEEASDFLSRMPPAEAGEMLYEQRGCKQCHSVDGSAGIAPTFLGLFGTEEQLADGSRILVDENYVRESIYDPMSRVTAGYDPVMPTYRGRLKDEEATAIIEYIKTLRQ
ncbi:MAG: cytochrome c oxidase subunit II [bacterium]|nr:cytochrome c oxidase subunit II [bacterium]